MDFDQLVEPWMADGLCIEYPHIEFFPERGQDSRPAKAVCARCLVVEDCRDYIAAHPMPGVWGGMSERERRQARRGLPRPVPEVHYCAGRCGTITEPGTSRCATCRNRQRRVYRAA